MYLIFTGDYYYPEGGWADYRGYTDTLEEAVDRVCNLVPSRNDWGHIVDIDAKGIVYTYGDTP